MSGAARFTPLWTGPDHYDRLRAWARENGHSIGPNGYVSGAAAVAFRQAWTNAQAAQSGQEPTR